MVRRGLHLRYTGEVRASLGLWCLLAIGSLIAATAGADQIPGPLPGETPKEMLSRARSVAYQDRGEARALVEQVIATAPDDALRWDALLWRCSDLEVHEELPERSVARCGPLWDRVLADDIPGDDLRTRRRLETRTADILSRALARVGRTDEARAIEVALQQRDRARTGTPASVAAPGPKDTPLDRARQATIARWRSRLGVASWAMLAVFALVALPRAVRGARGGNALQAPKPMVGAALVAGFALTAGAIGRGWEPGAGRFGWTMAAGFAAVHVVAALSLRLEGGRGLLRLLAALATVACGYLAMQASGTLAWVGL